MLISVHLPKTAGSSFRATLEQAYGDRFLARYEDQPLHRTTVRRRVDGAISCAGNALVTTAHHDCVHGHFLPLKYRFMRAREPVQFVTWLREPAQRLLSHYHYWKRHYDPATAGALHTTMIREQWSLEEFCLRPELRNVYAQFLWGFPLRRFDFVGITEHYDEDLEQFCRRFLDAGPVRQDAQVAGEWQNRNPHRADDPYEIDEALRQRIAEWHSVDMDLYANALKLRRERMSRQLQQ